MEPDDLLASEKLERLQRRQSRRRRRSSGNSPDFEDLNDEDEGALDAEAAEAQHDAQTSESRVRPRRQAPYIIYPEVLVIVDYDGYRLHGGDNLQVRNGIGNWDWPSGDCQKKKTLSVESVLGRLFIESCFVAVAVADSVLVSFSTLISESR